MENKKTKLTISGSPKKSFKKLDTAKTHGKKTVIIEKKSSRSSSKVGSKSFGLRPSTPNFKHGSGLKANFSQKTFTSTSDFERRKLAEQRATKKLKSESETDKKNKLGTNISKFGKPKKIFSMLEEWVGPYPFPAKPAVLINTGKLM